MKLALYCTLVFFCTSTYSQWNLVGDASNLGGECFRITPEINTQEGAVWLDSLIDLNDDFDLRFDIYLGDKDFDGADGITFVLQRDNDNIGIGGGSLGYESINESLVIEFDTYQNGGFGDPSYDHIGMMSNGAISHLAADALTGTTYIIDGTANAEDGNWHNVKVLWDFSAQNLSVYVDCEFRLEYTGDIINDIFGGDPLVYLGYTGATGGLNNDQQVCFDGFYFPVEIDSIEDVTICFGDSVQLTAPDGFDDYSWDPDIGISDDEAISPYFFPSDTTIYTLTAEGYCGEIYTDEIIINVIPDNSFFSYPELMVCPEGTLVPDDIFESGGIFTIEPDGASINSLSGEIDLEEATPGDYIIEYNPPDNGCPFSSSVIIAVVAFPDASFSYEDLTHCAEGIELPDFIAISGGVFSASDPGLDLNTTTGEIDFSSATVGDTITIWYEVEPFCYAIDSFDIIITDFEDPFFSYDATSYCPSGTVLPDVVLTAGGTFSVSPAGLDVNSSTGEIDLSTGTEGSVYTITYVTSTGECGNEFELDITIDFLDDPGFGYGASSFCATGLLDPAFVNTPGGFFSSDPSTLSIDFLTGTIDLETGTVGESYTIKYLTPDGPCQDSSFVTITIDPNDDSSFSYIADTFCPFGTSLPDLIATPGGEFSILPAIGLPLDPSSGTLTLEGAIPGVYSITYQTPEGLCTSSSVFTVTIDSVVNASFGYSDTGFCQVGEAVPDVLNAGGVFSSVPGISIDPVSGIINLEASTTGGPYEIYYASPGCSETDTAYVTIFPNPVLGLDLITPVCIEDNAMLLGATPAGGTFSGEGVTGDLFNPALLSSGGLYTINYMYTDGNGCSSEINGSIEVIEHTVSAGIDVSIVEGTSTTLQAVGGIIYTWSPAEGLSCTGCASPTAQPLVSTTYTVVSFDGFGCVASDTVRVTLVPFDDLTVFVPNAFTPNGDGSNDFLTGYGSDIEVIEVFQIYDRWGNTIWEGKQLLPGVENMGWDGSINGKSANPGVYAYKAIVRFTYGVSTIASGNVTLMR